MRCFWRHIVAIFAQDDIRVALTPAQREMLDKWNCLTSAQQAALTALMDTMR